VSFEVTGLTTGSTVTVTMTMPAGSSPNAYVRCNAALTACSPAGGTTISGNTLTLTLTDGGPGDGDGVANGVIVVPGAPAITLAVPHYYLPYSATPEGGGSGNSLFVVPSDAPSSSPQFVEQGTYTGLVGTVSQWPTNDQGQAYARIPYGMVYVSSPWFERLDLTAGSALAPVRISSAQAGPICSSFTDQFDSNDPSTAYFIIQEPIPGTGSETCGKQGTDYFLLIHYGDSATTQPGYLPLGGGNASVASFHDSVTGKLTGFVGVDTSGNLNFYPDATFTNSKPLLANAGGFAVIQSTPQYAFLAVYPPGSGSYAPSGYYGIAKASLYRVDGKGDISADLYDFQANACSFNGSDSDGSAFYYYSPTCNSTVQAAPDGKSLFFTDNSFTDNSGDPASTYPYDINSYSDRLVQVALDGTAPAQVVQAVSGGPAPAPHHAHRPVTVLLGGFVDSRLLYAIGAPGSNGSGYPGYVYALDSAAGSATKPVQIAATQDGYYGFDGIGGGQLWANQHRFDPATGDVTDLTLLAILPDGTLAHQYPSAEIWAGDYAVSGTPVNPKLDFSDLILLTGFASPQGGTSVNYDGAALQKLSLDDLSLTPFKTAAGSPYVVSNSSIPSIANSADPVAGAWISRPNTDNAAVVDVPNNVLVEIIIPNSLTLPLY
jgi:hypothetical protein